MEQKLSKNVRIIGAATSAVIGIVIVLSCIIGIKWNACDKNGELWWS